MRLFQLLMVLLVAFPAAAQVDIGGPWQTKQHEDLPERGPGPRIGDYSGMPVNDSTRMRGDSWVAEQLAMVEHQCQEHPADYEPRGPSNMRIWPEVDRLTQAVIAWHTTTSYNLPERTIYMDGRPHPPEWAPHTWQGFSTGEWEGDMLKVTTTHLREGWMRRNGLARSDRADLVEYFVRHHDYLTLFSITYDPVYATAPVLRSSDWFMNEGMQLTPNLCIFSIEIDYPRGFVPHHLPGKNPWLTEFPEQTGIPYEAMRGGEETMYPEYQKKMAQMPSPPPRPVSKDAESPERSSEGGE